MKKYFSIELRIIIISIALYGLIGSLSVKVKSLGDLDFHNEAIKIVSCLKAGNLCSEVSLNKAPLPSIFYVIPYLAVPLGSDDGKYWFAALFWTGLLSTLSIIILYWSAQNIFDSRLAGLICIGMSFIIPLHIYYGLGVLAEGPAFIAVSLAVYGASMLHGKLRKGLILYSVGIILLILSRPNAILILPVLIAISLFLLWRKIGNGKVYRGLVFSASGSLATVIVIIYIVNSLPGNTKESQENYFLHVAQHGRFQFRNETWDWRFWDNDTRVGSVDYMDSQKTKQLLDEEIAKGEAYESVYRNWIKQDILSNPVVTIKQFLIRIVYGHTLTINSVVPEKFKIGPLKGKVGYYLVIGGLNFINWSMILLALYGLFFYRSLHEKLLPLLMIWFALVVFSALVYMEQRYLFPARPVILMLASGGLLHLLERLKLRLNSQLGKND